MHIVVLEKDGELTLADKDAKDDFAGFLKLGFKESKKTQDDFDKQSAERAAKAKAAK